MKARQALREATTAAHQRVDDRFAALDLAEPVDYGRFLTAHAAALIPLEEALDKAGAENIVPGWNAHRRTNALLADLADLGLPVSEPTPAPSFADEARLLGGLYVLEGSRLGGAVLRRSVPPSLPRRFLDAVHAPGCWPALVALLDRKLYASRALGSAVDAALASFAMFERAEWALVDE